MVVFCVPEKADNPLGKDIAREKKAGEHVLSGYMQCEAVLGGDVTKWITLPKG